MSSEVGEHAMGNDTKPAGELQSAILVPAYLIGFIADILIIITIAKYSRIKTRMNHVILSWSISDCIFLFGGPTVYDALSEVIKDETVSCVLANFTYISFLSAIIFQGLLLMDPVIKSEQYAMKWISVIIYAYQIFLVVVISIICYTKSYELFTPVFTIIGWIYLVISVIAKYIKKSKGEMDESDKKRLTFVNIFVCTWTICCLCYFVQYFLHNNKFMIYFDIIGYINPLLVTLVLMKLDDKFRECYLKMFICRSKKNNDNDINHTSDTNKPETA